MPEIHTNRTLKSTREALCAAAAALGQHGKTSLYDAQMDALNALIRDIDRQRPLGPNGKHGDRHTPTCGCDDVEPSPAHTPLTDAELESLRELLGISTATTADLERLLAEVGWLRADRDEWRAGAIEAIRENERNLARVSQLETLADSLRDSEAKLVALEAAGVDNWVGYEAAMEMLKEDSDDE